MKYLYRGVDARARNVKGEIEANTDAEARALLRSRHVRPRELLLLNEKGEAVTVSESSSSGLSLFNSKKPKLMDFTAFIRQFATMQGAGIPIVQTLGVLAQQQTNKAFGGVLEEVRASIEGGAAFHESLRKYPDVFDKIFINLIAAGELSGSLEAVLNRLAVYYEKAASLRRKVLSALTYPALIIVLVIGVMLVLLMFVVPTFAKMFQSNGKELPEATQAVLDISNFLIANWMFVFGGIAAAIGLIAFAAKDENSRRAIDPLLMHVPLFGDLIRKISIARFSRTLGTMIQSGVPILDALDITSRVAGNYAVEGAIQRTRDSITQGNSIAGPLGQAGIFPPMAVSMIAVGEQTGALEQMLTKVAEFYEDEVDAKVSSLTSLLEPLMIVIVGLVVAAILIPMYLPIFKMADTMGQ